MSRALVKAVILTLDNVAMLQQQLSILREEPEISGIVVVDNGSEDGTAEWLATQRDLTVVRRETRSPGPGRNAGLDAAGRFDYVLLLDGGIRPLRGALAAMMSYLERRSDAAVLGLEIDDMVGDAAAADAAWPRPITDGDTYRNTMISHTAYALARATAFDGLRFNDHGPFAEPGWGVDDNEMCFRWNQRGLQVHVVRGVRPYRHKSGSFARLVRETGVWPNQYGSVYEKRLVYCQQEWPQYGLGVQRGEPWLTLLVHADDSVEATIRLVKRGHDLLRTNASPLPRPYSIVVCAGPGHPFRSWAEPRRLRQHHGDTIIVDGQIVRRGSDNEALWTGDLRLHHGPPVAAVRPGAHWWAEIRDQAELDRVVAAHAPVMAGDRPPAARHQRLVAA